LDYYGFYQADGSCARPHGFPRISLIEIFINISAQDKTDRYI